MTFNAVFADVSINSKPFSSAYACASWKRTTINYSSLSGLLLALQILFVTPCDHFQLLGAIISSDLSLNQHVSNISSSSFYWLRHLWRIQRSLDKDLATTLVHSFVSSCIDYCNTLLAAVPKAVTDKLQRVLKAAAYMVSGIHKYDPRLVAAPPIRVLLAQCGGTSRVQTCRHDVWLSAWPRTTVFDGPLFAVSVSSRQHLQSATPRFLAVLWCQLSTFGPHAFSVAGLSIWNSLPDSWHDPALKRDNFRHLLKTHLFTLYWSI